MKLYMFRTVHLSIIRSLFTVHSAMLHVIQVCRQLSSRTRTELSSILVLFESCLSIIRNLFTVHSVMVYVIQVCGLLSNRTRMELRSVLVLLESCLQICMTYTITECTVNKLLMMDRRTVRTM